MLIHVQMLKQLDMARKSHAHTCEQLDMARKSHAHKLPNCVSTYIKAL